VQTQALACDLEMDEAMLEEIKGTRHGREGEDAKELKRLRQKLKAALRKPLKTSRGLSQKYVTIGTKRKERDAFDDMAVMGKHTKKVKYVKM